MRNSTNILICISFDVHVCEVSASGFVVCLQQFGYDAALCRYDVLHAKQGRHSIVLHCVS